MVALSSLFRSELAVLINNDVARYYPTDPVNDNAFNEAFAHSWASGSIFIQEFVLSGFCALASFAVLYRFRSKPFLASAGAALLILTSLIVAAVSGWMMDMDYDFFYKGTVIGPLFTSLLGPLFSGSSDLFLAVFLLIPILTLSLILVSSEPHMAAQGHPQ